MTSPLPEPLFLDLSLQDVVNKTAGMPVVEPWASAYVDAIKEGRYGDALWSRYHIGGDVLPNDVIPGMCKSQDKTVMESIEEDLWEARVGEPEEYANAVLFYSNSSTKDWHPEIIDMILRVGREDVDIADEWEDEEEEEDDDDIELDELQKGRNLSNHDSGCVCSKPRNNHHL